MIKQECGRNIQYFSYSLFILSIGGLIAWSFSFTIAQKIAQNLKVPNNLAISLLSKARIGIDISLILGCLVGNYFYYEYYNNCGEFKSEASILVIFCIVSQDLVMIIAMKLVIVRCFYVYRNVKPDIVLNEDNIQENISRCVLAKSTSNISFRPSIIKNENIIEVDIE